MSKHPYDERERLTKKGYEIRYSAYGITVKYQGQTLLDLPKHFNPGPKPRFQYQDEMEKAAAHYLDKGIEAAQKHEEGTNEQ